MNKNKDEILEEREITGNKKKLLLWGSLALVLIILTAALLLIFLLPKGNKYYIETNSSLDVVLEGRGEYAEGEEVTIKAEDIEGYRFRNWTLNGIEVSRDLEYTFKASDETDGTYRANYDKLFKITIANIENGSILTDKTEAIEGEAVEIEVNPNVEYMLGEIYYIVEGTSVRVDIVNNKFEMPLGNITIYGNFEQIKYVLELESNITDVELIGAGEYTLGEKVTIKASEKEGYRFRNWTLNGEEVSRTPEFLYQINKSENVTLIANYDKLFKITIANVENGSISTNKTEAIEGEEVEVNVEAKQENYTLNELYYMFGEEKYNIILDNEKYKFLMPNQDIILFASFTEVTIETVSSSYTVSQIKYSNDSILTPDDEKEDWVLYNVYLRLYNNNMMTFAVYMSDDGYEGFNIYKNIEFELQGTKVTFKDPMFMMFVNEINILDNDTITFNYYSRQYVLTKVDDQIIPEGEYFNTDTPEDSKPYLIVSDSKITLIDIFDFTEFYYFGSTIILVNSEINIKFIFDFSLNNETLILSGWIYDQNTNSFNTIPSVTLIKK